MLVVFSINAQQIIEANEGVRRIAWSPDQTMLATANPDGKIFIWDTEGQLRYTFSAQDDGAISVAWSPDSRFIASGGQDAMIRVWDIEQEQLIAEIEAFQDGVFNLAWQPTGDILVSSGFDVLKAWDTRTWLPIADGSSITITDMAWSPLGNQIAITATPNVILVLDVSTEVSNGIALEGHSSLPYAVSWNSQGVQLVSAGGQDGSVRLWDVETATPIRVLLQVDETVYDAIFLDDGHVAASTNSGNIYFINITNGEIEQTLHRNAQIWSLAWNSDANLLAIAGLPNESSQTGMSNTDLATQNIIESDSGNGFLDLQAVEPP
jgi:WD40 repeat protein